MPKKSLRSGKSNGFIAMGLFLLSCLLIFPSLKWAFDDSPTSPAERKPYQFAIQKAESETNDPNLGDANRTNDELSSDKLRIKTFHWVEDMQVELAQFETVFWEPDDTNSLRDLIRELDIEQSKTVLEIGTGTGLISLCCIQQGIERVVATDINPQAVANAAYNAELLGYADQLETRLVPESDPGPFSTISTSEKFDLIISNPPWEDAEVDQVAAHALYDPNFQLLDEILSDAQKHLNTGGKLLLAYGAKTAIQRIQKRAVNAGWNVTLLDQRQLDDLPEVFLPGMLIELTSAEPKP